MEDRIADLRQAHNTISMEGAGAFRRGTPVNISFNPPFGLVHLD